MQAYMSALYYLNGNLLCYFSNHLCVPNGPLFAFNCVLCVKLSSFCAFVDLLYLFLNR